MINQTVIIITIVLSVCTIVIPRKYFLLPFVLCACFVPADQRVIILDLDFTPLRILLAAGVLRLFWLGEIRGIKWNCLDKLVAAWAIYRAVIFVILFREISALINVCGKLYDILGLYWLFRICIRSWNDIKVIIIFFSFCCLILGFLVALEWKSGENPFELLGRVRTEVREGRYRCQASFPHAIILGAFWATLLPLFIGFARQNKHKLLFWSAAGVSVFITIASASSTPIFIVLIVILGLCAFRWRRYTGLTAKISLLMLIALHIVMEAPVWHLISRISVVGGSTGWHRYNIINKTIQHFNEWALIGCTRTAHWGYGLVDVTNQYCMEGIHGGLATLIIFLILIYKSLRILLDLSLCDEKGKHHFLLWCLFVSIIGHCAAFFGVAYFGQIHMLWYMVLAMVGRLYQSKRIMKPSYDTDGILKYANKA